MGAFASMLLIVVANSWKRKSNRMKVLSFHRIPIIVTFLIIMSALWCVAGPQAEKLKILAQKYYWGKGVKQDYSNALQLYLKAVELGDTEAQYIAGGMYFRGFGTRKNFRMAFSLLYGAALKGNSTPESQKILGQFFLTGKLIPRNYAEAIKWYRLSAENGDRDSQGELAFLYFTGRGTERDFDKAFLWFEKSASQGLASSQYSLGIMYYSGNGVEKADAIKAYAWLSLAAAQNHNGAIAARDYIETVISSADLQKAQDYAILLFQKIKR